MILVGLLFFYKAIAPGTGPKTAAVPYWQFRSIDTVKYSRDLSREKLADESFDLTINTQVGDIAKTGASHIAISTPYDDEFNPMLKRWVQAARKYKLKVWFRGNFSGWEKWFGYDKIDRNTHLKKTEDFILKNPYFFENGDIFTPCPECENGGSGDPRQTGGVEDYRKFLIDEYQISQKSFKKIGKDLNSGFYSMNYDVATLVMDKDTTKSLGGIVVIDHYVGKPEKLISDINKIAVASGGKVVLGEFGVPIPDINGRMNEEQQSDWISSVLENLKNNPNVIGINYWVSVGGSTQLWNKNGNPRKAVKTITSFYTFRKFI